MLKLSYRNPVPNHEVDLTKGPTREGFYTKRRVTKLPVHLSEYQGENLVFIVGPPRSGTTWVLKLLSEHPDVVAATKQNLGLDGEQETMETGIFETGLMPHTIKSKFLKLSEANPGKVIVEKTPVHLMHAGRIMRIFPKAALVLTRRGGRDTVASILEVGRRKDSWWKNAPWKAEAACELWKKYAIASSRCEGMLHPYIVRYEDLINEPSGTLITLLMRLGLQVASVMSMVMASARGRNIGIPGVFNKGKIGNWREVMTGEDVDVFERYAQPFDWQPLDNGAYPKVTVVLSTFERPDGMMRSFRSLLEQSLDKENMEIIVCDDGSRKPGVKDMLFRLGNNYNVSIIRGAEYTVEHKEKFCTFTQLINRALTVARGEYITYLTDGDIYRQGRCHALMTALDNNKTADLVWCRTVIMENKRRRGPEKYRTFLNSELRSRLPRGNFIDHNTFMHRRSHVRWSTSPDSWRFADWLFLQRMVLDGAWFMPVDYVGQTLYLNDNSLGLAAAQGKQFKDVIAKRRKG